ncbi:hypothetical protein [Herbiconiux ginsengi]|uniref:hypothetical protein n=1 Tax=Herbiconiux ginsengi TaxID=381665 RepID=UPI0015871020|nr:hypothetical protein [Herbiconiux ginsengi]
MTPETPHRLTVTGHAQRVTAVMPGETRRGLATASGDGGGDAWRASGRGVLGWLT